MVQNWSVRLGGKWFFSLRAYLISASLGFLFISAAEEFSAKSASEIVKWISIFLFSAAILGLFELLFAKTVFSRRFTNPISPLIAISFNALTGILFSSMIVTWIAILDIQSRVGTIERIFTYAIFSAWWGSILSIYLDIREEQKILRKKLVEEAVMREIARLQQSVFSLEVRESLENEVRHELETAQFKIEKSGDTSMWLENSKALMRAAEGSVRRVSQELSDRGSLSYPKVKFWEIPRDIFKHQKFATLSIIFIDLIAAAPEQLRLMGTVQGLQIIAAATSLIFIICTTVNKLMDKFPDSHVFLFCAGILLLQVTVVPVRTYLRNIWIPGMSGLTWQIFQVVAGVIVILVASGTSAWQDLSNQISRTFAQNLNEKKIVAVAESIEISNLAREASRILHGSVQTRLISCAMVIQQAAQSGDQERINLALTEALEILRSPLSISSNGGSVTQEVERKVHLWDELCNFRLKVEDQSEADIDSRTILIGRIVEEGISNSIRHGRAKNIEISVSVAKDYSSIIQISDDGMGIASKSPGLGSAFLEQESRGNWSLKEKDFGVVLKVLLPSL